jgi:hypothetical protein
LSDLLLCLHSTKFKQITGETPIVIDADELENNPDGVPRAYCVPSIPQAIHWEVGGHIKTGTPGKGGM